MTARIQALIILVIFLALPAGLYWYFYNSKISSLILLPSSDKPFQVRLEGKLSYKYFPILDKAFSYKSVCSGSCILSPIPPITYTLTLISTGGEDTVDTLTLLPGETRKYNVFFTPTITLTPLTISDTPDVSSLGNIGISHDGEVLSYEKISQTESIIKGDKHKNPIYRANFPIEKIYLDESRTAIVLVTQNTTQYIISIDDGRSTIFPYSREIVIADIQGNKVQSTDGLYEYIGSRWQKNPRFTDFIDISERYRIGYIDKTDADLLGLQNLPLGISQTFLLDRKTGTLSPLKIDKNIRGFYSYGGAPFLIDTAGERYFLTLDTSYLP